MAKEITIKHLILSLDRAVELIETGTHEDVESGIRIVKAAMTILSQSGDPEVAMFEGEPNDALIQLEATKQLADVSLLTDGGNGTVPITRKNCKSAGA